MRGRRTVVLLTLAALRWTPATGAEPATAPVIADHTVELPPLLVEAENGKGPRWRYGTLPGEEILSGCEDDTTKQAALQLYRLHERLRQVIPPDLLPQFSEPATLIFYPKGESESLSHEMLKEMERVESAHGESAAYRQMPNLELPDSDSYAVFSIIEEPSVHSFWDQMRSPWGTNFQQMILSQDHVRILLDMATPTPAPWLSIGVSRLFERAIGGTDEFRFGASPWVSSDAAAQLRNNSYAFRPLLPIHELLRPAPPGPANSPAFNAYLDLWRAQCELFVRWALASGGQVRRDAFWRFAEETKQEPPSEPRFMTAFGLSFADVRDELSDYLLASVDGIAAWPAPPLPKDPKLSLRDAPPDLVRRIKGEWTRRTLSMIHSHYPQLLPIYSEQARALFQKGFDDGARDPRFMEAFGLFYASIGEDALARSYLEASRRAGAKRPLALTILARLRLADVEAHPAGDQNRLGEGQVQSVMEIIRQARTLSPPIVGLYAVLLELCDHQPDPPSPEQLAWLNEGATDFPRQTRLVVETATWDEKVGRTGDALRLARIGLYAGNHGPDLDRLAALRNGLIQPASKKGS